MTAHSAQLSKCMCIKNNLLSLMSDCCLHDTFSKSMLFPAQEAGYGICYLCLVFYLFVPCKSTDSYTHLCIFSWSLPLILHCHASLKTEKNNKFQQKIHTRSSLSFSVCVRSRVHGGGNRRHTPVTHTHSWPSQKTHTNIQSHKPLPQKQKTCWPHLMSWSLVKRWGAP